MKDRVLKYHAMKKLIFIALIGCLSTTAEGQAFRTAELNVQFHRAQTAWSTGNSLLEAKARIDRVLAADSDDQEALKLRAKILNGLERADEAHRDARKAAELVPTDGEAHLLVCETAAQIELVDEALNALDTASDLFLDGSEQYVRLSACALQLGQTTRAESIARIAVAQDVNDPRGHVQLARVFLTLNEPDAARSVLANAVDDSILSMNAIMADAQLVQLFLDEPLNQD